MKEVHSLKLTKQILLLPKENYLIILNSKCASSSIRRMALWKLGYEGAAEGRRGGLLYLRQFKSVRNCQLDKWVVIVRNPYDRMASLWLDKTQRIFFKGFRGLGISKGIPFKDFVKVVANAGPWQNLDSHLWPQTIIARHFWDRLQKVRVEDLPWAWPKDLPQLEKENVAKTKVDYSSLWDNETRRIFRKRYNDDMRLLPYEL